MLLIPAGLYIAIAVACTIFIFPQSLSHIVMTDLLKTNLKPIQSILKLQDDVLAVLPSDTTRIAELAGKAKKLRAAHVQGVNALEGQMPMLQLEVTRSQMGAGDLIKVFEKSKEVGSRSFGLATFVVRARVTSFGSSELMPDAYGRDKQVAVQGVGRGLVSYKHASQEALGLDEEGQAPGHSARRPRSNPGIFDGGSASRRGKRSRQCDHLD